MKEFVSWEEVEQFVQRVVSVYRGNYISGVYGLPRGGLVLAVMISHRLGVPLLMAPNLNCIIVDDICDSGESLLHYFKNSSSDTKTLYHIVTMYYKENANEIVPEMFQKKKKDDWIVFPWENKED